MTSIEVETKEIVLKVPANCNLDEWFDKASPQDIAAVLEIAIHIPTLIRDHKDEYDVKITNAKLETMNDTIQKVLHEASVMESDKYKHQLSELQSRVDETALQLTSQHNLALKEKDNFHTQMQALKVEHKRDLEDKDKVIEAELEKIRVFEEHLKQTHSLKLDVLRRDIQTENSAEYNTLHQEYTNLKIVYETLKKTVDQHISDARQEEIYKSLEREKEISDNHSRSYDALCQAKLECDNKLVEMATVKCQLTEEFSRQQLQYTTEIQALQNAISELKNPLNRGNCGEFDVAQTLRDAGFIVEDTSEGEKKDMGYLDLLVRHDDTTDNMRIAVEVKNKKTIKKASDDKVKRKDKDLDDDIKTFENRVSNGIKNGLFDAAIFVSIRAHTKMGGPVVMEMFPDTTNRPLAPVSYIGPEKSKVVVPLTQEQLETHVYMMFSVLEKCHVIQRDLCNGLKDDEIASFQTMFEDMSAFFNKTFVDLRKQEQLIQDMNSTLTSMRSRCISMFRSIHSTNEHIPWLKRKITPEWMSVYDQSLERSLTMNDADVWNRVSKHKATIESTIGKDAMMMAIRSELNEEQSKKKQKK